MGKTPLRYEGGGNPNLKNIILTNTLLVYLGIQPLVSQIQGLAYSHCPYRCQGWHTTSALHLFSSYSISTLFLIQLFKLFLKPSNCLMFLISVGMAFHIPADLTKNDFPDKDISNCWTLNVPSPALLVMDDWSFEFMYTGS